MNYRLIIRPEAEFDLEDAFAWYESQDVGLGSEFVRAIDNSISTIGRNPLAYRLIYQQARRVLVRRFPYCLFYVVEEDTYRICDRLFSQQTQSQRLARSTIVIVCG
jgi:plasmid stabilization system protein ParE